MIDRQFLPHDPVWSRLTQVPQLQQENTLPAMQKALELVREAAALAEPGSHDAIWANALLASWAIDFGCWEEAEAAAERYLAQEDVYPDALEAKAWVLFALGRAYRRTGRLRKALPILRMALRTAKGELRERVLLYIVWMLCEVGRPRPALRLLPRKLAYLPETYRRAARACVLMALGDWQAAAVDAELVIEALEKTPLYDGVQIAKLCEILRYAADRDGQPSAAAHWASRGGRTPALWRLDSALIQPPNTAKGGVAREVPDAPTGPRPAGHDRMGLTGTVG